MNLKLEGSQVAGYNICLQCRSSSLPSRSSEFTQPKNVFEGDIFLIYENKDILGVTPSSFEMNKLHFYMKVCENVFFFMANDNKMATLISVTPLTLIWQTK